MTLARRTFLRGVSGAALVSVAVACGDDDAALPTGPVVAGDAVALTASAATAGGVVAVPEIRGYLVEVPPSAAEEVAALWPADVAAGVRDHGLLALFQKCPHQGCRVPWEAGDGEFRCPCHGSVFDAVGLHVSGPSNRGLSAFGITVEGGDVLVDTTTVHDGPEAGTRLPES